MKNRRLFFLALIAALLFTLPSAVPQAKKPAPKPKAKSESEDHFRKWLNEDVVYIITDDEKAVFQKLNTPEEKEQFIEQFWERRNPDPRSSTNEFKEEHYRRIAYANDHFTSGDPGWMTDRGRIYIIHGKPDEIEARPAGGAYNRPIEEGGGTTAVHPYEKWRYRYIEGMGTNIEMEFVDATNTGKYELAVFPWEKDALLQIGLGPTLAEQEGLATRADHPALNPAAAGAQYGPASWFSRRTDTPFMRYEQVAKLQAAPIVKFQALKEVVQVNVKYSNLPFQVRGDYFKLNEGQVLVPITVLIKNTDLTFKTEGSAAQVAHIGIYGSITTLAGRTISEFEDEVVTGFRKDNAEDGMKKASIYQKTVTLNRNTRYKLDLVLKDINSGNIGVAQQALIPPTYGSAGLSSSSLVLSNAIQPLPAVPTSDQMFVLGDVKIVPKLDKRFSTEMPLGVYMQLYNIGLDQSSGNPSLLVAYKLLQNGKVLAVATDEKNESIQFFSGRRVVLVKELSLSGLEPGPYQIQVEAQDRLTNQKIEVSANFTVYDPNKSQ
jgi:GWxTD domain-containing protein